MKREKVNLKKNRGRWKFFLKVQYGLDVSENNKLFMAALLPRGLYEKVKEVSKIRF